jgi:hypothetical protein
MWAYLVATFGEAVMNSLLKAFTGWLSDIRNEQAREELGASKQREVDINAELDRITRAAEAGSDPANASPDGLRDDPNNRDNQP